MKKTIQIMIMAAMFGMLFTNCKKDPGPKGETGAQGPAGVPGPQAKTFNFNLTFNAGDTFQSYSGITGYDTDDVIMFYVLYEAIGTTNYWTPLPVIVGAVNFVPEFSETTGSVFMNTLKSNGTTGSPWTSSITLPFKAVLIKSSGRIKNVNLHDYEAVKKAYQLQD